MGLKEKAASAQKHRALSENESAREPSPLPDIYENQESTLPKGESVGLQDLLGTEKMEKLSPFLLPDDILSATVPSDSSYSIQNKLESLLNLFEVCKEIASIDSEDELWEAILFNILGQVGSREIAIFFKDNGKMDLKAVKGYIIPENFNFSKRSGIERILNKEKAIHYSRDLVPKLVGDEQVFLKSLSSELIIPILKFEQLVGFIILAKPITSNDFHSDDLLYLKLLGELLGAFYESIQRILYLDTHRKIWAKREKDFQEFIYFQNRIQYSEAMEDSRNLLEEYLENIFHFQMYMFLMFDNKKFTVHLQKGFQEKTIKKFVARPGDDWIIECKNKYNWYDYNNFKENKKFMNKFSVEDREIIKMVKILPFHIRGNLLGLLLLFEVKEGADLDQIEQARSVLLNYFWYTQIEMLSGEHKKNLEKTAQDPLHILDEIIQKQEEELSANNTPFNVVTLYISNSDQIINLEGQQNYNRMKNEIKLIIKKGIRKTEYFAEIIPNRLLFVSQGISKKDVWSLEKNLRKKITKKFSKLKPILQSSIYSRPEDNIRPPEKLLFL